MDTSSDSDIEDERVLRSRRVPHPHHSAAGSRPVTATTGFNGPFSSLINDFIAGNSNSSSTSASTSINVMVPKPTPRVVAVNQQYPTITSVPRVRQIPIPATPPHIPPRSTSIDVTQNYRTSASTSAVSTEQEFKCTLLPKPDPKKAEWISCKVPWKYQKTDDFHFFGRPLVKLPDKYIPDKDVFIRNEVTSPNISFLLPICGNDRLEVLLFKKEKDRDVTPTGIKPSAQKATLTAFWGSRSFEDIQNYLAKCSEWLNDSQCRTEAINSILSSEALWVFLWNAKSKDSSLNLKFKELVVQFTLNLMKHIKTQPTKLRNIIEKMIESNYLQNHSKYTMELTHLVVEVDPSLLKKIIPLLSKTINSSGPNQLVKGMFELFQKVGKVVDLSDWKTLKPIPVTDELLGGPLERSEYLSPVVLQSPYSSPESYLSVYYRLLRTECFSAIQNGIKELMEGRLNPRDMDVYEHVKFTGLELVKHKVVIYLRFTQQKKVSNWKASRKLMFCNLLCATISGDFSDCIWMTVLERDPDILQKHSTIGVELISFNESDSNHAQMLNKLLVNSGKIVMVESPTYFQSFKHVLTSLKHSELHEFNLMDEIVHGKYSPHVGFDSNLYANQFNKVKTDLLEDHQYVAFLHALKSPLAIIQGPPGTGKTFVGAKLAYFLLCLLEEKKLNTLLGPSRTTTTDQDEVSDDSGDESEDLDNPPILILTYKNHALDEFLKHCLKFCNASYITRIGGQSKEEALNECLLHKKFRTQKIKRISDLEVRTALETKSGELSKLIEGFREQKVFMFEKFITQLTSDQLKLFATTAVNKKFKKPPKNPINKGVKINVQKINDLFETYGDEFGNELVSILKSDDKTKSDLRFLALKLKDAFEHHWLPNRENLVNLTELSLRGASFFNSSGDFTEEEEEEEEEEDDHDANDDMDEDYINEQLQSRASAIDDDYRGDTRNDPSKSSSSYLLNLISTDQTKDDTSDFTLSDFPRTCKITHNLVTTSDVWDLSEIEKYSFIFSYLNIGLDDILIKINEVFEDIGLLQQKKQVIDEKNKVLLLKTQKIVGATIVGASIQLSLLQKLGPKVVIVEEAAEVLESCLVAVLGKSVQKLILIGDHMQLRPQVDTYYLRREHNFHISMMERLIKLNFPFKSLVKQGRMRTEFSKMLKDIYPDYDNFDDLDEKNKPLKCVPKSMFFWSHTFDETKFRSVTNEKEANMVVALALYFISSGVKEEDLTILCGYLGQVQLVRKTLKSFFQKKYGGRKPLIEVKTIDEYQGDENEYVIISLTRSNRKKILGFMKEKERRCVAQSRAKCGLYFVGNFDMFKNDKTWKPVTSIMEREGCVGHQFPLHCYKHPSVVYHVIQSQDILDKATPDKIQLMNYVHSNNNWCNMKCNTLFECKIELHRCKKSCTPRHDDSKCRFMVPFVFGACNHPDVKECHQDVEKLICKTEVTGRLQCGHDVTVTCHKWLNNRIAIMCFEPCSDSYTCQLGHKCKKICGEEHSHDAASCPEPVPFIFPQCGHIAHITKDCGKPIPSYIVCRFQLKYESPVCGHEQSRLCSKKEECVIPCTKTREDCGHPCQKMCHERCLKDECEVCKVMLKEVLKTAKKEAEAELKRLKKSNSKAFKLIPISNGLEFTKIVEKCQMIFGLYTSCNIAVAKVWKVQTPNNYTERFLERALQAFGPSKEELFHISHGFIIDEEIVSPEDLYSHVYKENCFRFVKFASKSTIRRSAEFTIVVAEVITGDCMNSTDLSKSKRKSMLDTLKEAEKDSIIETLSGSAPASYTVYKRDQIKPLYVVTLFAEEKPKEEIIDSKDYFKDYEDGKEHVFDLNSINLRDVSDPRVEILQKAISLYQGDCSKRTALAKARNPMLEINSIGVVVNRNAEYGYERAKLKFETSGTPFTEVFGYHATKPENVSSIARSNLDPERKAAFGRWHGEGCYFSEHPQFSFTFGKETMFIFRLLLVENEYTKVMPDTGGFCNELVIQDISLFKPIYVLHFSNN